MPSVSVIVPCYNHGEFVAEAVDSVLRAQRDDVELLVVDDGSTDERTRREIHALQQRGVRVIRQDNKGLAAARNAGIAATTGKYVLPLDADNRVRPAYFERGLRILEANPQAGVVYGDLEYVGTRAGRQRVGPFEPGQIMQWNYIDACAMYRRAIWEQAGGYDGAMPVQGFEDWDLWLGALERGWEFVYVPEVLFDYRVADGSMHARGRPALAEVANFLARKHAALYRREWERLEQEHRSVSATGRNLRRLLMARLRRTFPGNGRAEGS